ncbi:MAG TPA: YigZ family protein [Prolixibacteraceae bacterium]|nr:YigZ family protein [Prolixibacteraceae bacterium]
MSIQDTYQTVEGNAEGLFKDKGSKFIAFISHVETEEEIKETIQLIKKEHFSARHHCYAYRLGYYGEKYRANDDGEPSGTAGKPIHGQLLSHNLTKTLIVVVRYFGGTLLGVSGLINAYKNAAADAIMNASIVTRIIENNYRLKFDYPLQNAVMKIIKDEQLEIVSASYELDCTLEVKVRINKTDTVTEKLATIIGLTVEPLLCE